MLEEQSAEGASFVRPHPRWINLREDIVELFEEVQNFGIRNVETVVSVLKEKYDYINNRRRGFNLYRRRRRWKPRIRVERKRLICLYCDKPRATKHQGGKSTRPFCVEHLDVRARAKISRYVIQKLDPNYKHPEVGERWRPRVVPKLDTHKVQSLPIEHYCPECDIGFGTLASIRAHAALKHGVTGQGLSDWLYKQFQAAE